MVATPYQHVLAIIVGIITFQRRGHLAIAVQCCTSFVVSTSEADRDCCQQFIAIVGINGWGAACSVYLMYIPVVWCLPLGPTVTAVSTSSP